MSTGESNGARLLGSMGNELTTRRLLAMVAAGVLVLIGIFGLWQPVYLDDYDKYGFQINCGTGLISDDSQAEVADGGSGERVSDCGTALLVRRAWSIPAIVGGAGILLFFALRGVRIVRHSGARGST